MTLPMVSDPPPRGESVEDACSIKFGAHQFMWKSHWTDADLPVLDAVEHLGLGLFEISLGDDVSFDAERLRLHAQALGIELTVGPGNEWPDACDLSSEEPETRERGLCWHKSIIDRAAELGAVAYCGAIYGRPGRVLRREPPRDELSRTAEGLRDLAVHAEGRGVRLVLEPMSRFRTHLINTAGQARSLLDLIGHPNVSVNLDTFHMVTEERDYGSAIRSLTGQLWGIHACESDRGVPGGGLVPWGDVLEALLVCPGELRIMFEAYNTGPGGFGFSRGIFKDLCPDPEAFVRSGKAFLEGLIEESRRIERKN
jgi:D-psicose/D-tagatose/L-ribulose 3-epimerase